MEITKENILKLPITAGVYTFMKGQTPIYIGKSVNLKSRLNSYLQVKLLPKTAQMIKEADDLTYIEVFSELESLLLESALIRKYKPKYNILLKDDKHALYIVITKEKFPRVLTSRKIDFNKFLKVYGPFPNSSQVKIILKLIRKIFPFSDHKLGKKACLYFHLGLCFPCPNITQDNREYLKNIRNINLILSRKFNIVRKSLEKEMLVFSKTKNYEMAKIIRDKIYSLDYITQKTIPEDEFIKNPNLSEEIKNREIIELKKIISKYGIKSSILNRIECFDIAHLSGSYATASMVVAIRGQMESRFFRHFKINQIKTNSDFDSMKEIAQRRLKHLEDWGMPDLVVVDGGLLQVKAFNNQFNEIGIPVVGIAKNPDRLVFSNGQKVRLSGDSLLLLSRIRDEAHRFARKYHHLLVKKNLLH